MLLSFPVTDQPVYLIEESTGVLWFKAADVCAILGFSNPAAAIGNHCPDDSKTIDYQSGRGRAALFISEPGLYLLIMESKSKLAREFKDWLAREVLPSIRKTGHFGGVPNIESGGSEFWNLIDNAMARQIEPERAIDLHHRFNGHASVSVSVETSAEVTEPKTRTSKALSNQGRKTELLEIVRRKWGDQPFTVRDVCRASIKFGSANNIKSLLDQLLADGDIQKRRVGTKTQYQLP